MENQNQIQREEKEHDGKLEEKGAVITGINSSSSSSSSSLAKKHIVILGSGFAGIEVLKRLEQKFKDNENIDITLVSRDNFLLFTP